jgi:GTP-sensing pleiotropic transcriptional regulator CodY
VLPEACKFMEACDALLRSGSVCQAAPTEVGESQAEAFVSVLEDLAGYEGGILLRRCADTIDCVCVAR